VPSPPARITAFILLNLEGKSYAYPVYRIDGAVHDQSSLLNPWPLLVEKSVGLPLRDVACVQPWRLANWRLGHFKYMGFTLHLVQAAQEKAAQPERAT
jgi:hypothetical protein